MQTRAGLQKGALSAELFQEIWPSERKRPLSAENLHRSKGAAAQIPLAFAFFVRVSGSLHAHFPRFEGGFDALYPVVF